MEQYKSGWELNGLTEKWYDTCLPEIKEEYYHNFYGVHGGGHIARVLGLSLTIATEVLKRDVEALSEDDIAVISLSATYDDIGRVHDWEDAIHGISACKKLEETEYLERLVEKVYPQFFLDSDNRAIVDFIIATHCIPDEMAFASLIVDCPEVKDKERAQRLYKIVCDADGLDRVRLGDLDTSYLRTDEALKFVDLAYNQFKIAEF